MTPAQDEILRQITGFPEQAGRDAVDLPLMPKLSASGYAPYPEEDDRGPAHPSQSKNTLNCMVKSNITLAH